MSLTTTAPWTAALPAPRFQCARSEQLLPGRAGDARARPRGRRRGADHARARPQHASSAASTTSSIDVAPVCGASPTSARE